MIRPREPGAALVRIAPDGRRLAYSIPEGEARGVHVAEGDGEAGQRWAEVADPWRIDELLWSPAGTHVAYVLCRDELTETERVVGWAARPVAASRWSDEFARDAGLGVTKPEEAIRSVPGNAFVWAPQGRSLIVADSSKGTLTRVPLTGDPEPLGELRDDGHPRFPPRLAISPDGRRVAYSVRRIDERVCEVWALSRDGGAPKLVTQIPGSQAHVTPFWSPKGNTLGIHIVHLELDRSAIVTLPHLAGEGVVLHESELADAAEAPVWSPSGESIVFQRADAPARHTLTALHCATRAASALAGAGEVCGRPSFLGDGRLAVDGGPSAHVLAPVW